MAKYLDYDGLEKVWGKIDTLFARKEQLTSLYKVKGSCATASLPTTGQVEGDVWNLTDAGTYGPAGTNVVWVDATKTEPIVEGHWDSLGAPIQNATTTSSGLMTSTMVTKLNGIAAGAEVNQNAFKTIAVKASATASATNVVADNKEDTLTLVAGSNITLSPNASTDQITITAKDTTYSDATTTSSGLMTSTMVTKLNGIAENANNYTHPTYTSATSGLYKVTVDGTGHVSATTAVKKTDITALGIPGQDTTYSDFTGANEEENGTAGLVPAPSSGDENKFLKGDGSWADVTTDVFGAASASSAGTIGLVPAPSAGTTTRVLTSGGSWVEPAKYTLPTASSTTLGGVKTGSAITDVTGYTAVHINNGVIYYKDNNTAKATAQTGNVNYKIAVVGSAEPTNNSAYGIFYDTAITLNPSTDTITATNFAGNATTATTASKLGTSTVGGITTPIYLNNGVPTACSYTLGASVPSDAVFTDTTYGAEKGISLTNGKYGHSHDAITAITTQGLYKLAFNEYGHITGYAAATEADIPGLSGKQDAMTAITETEINNICGV